MGALVWNQPLGLGRIYRQPDGTCVEGPENCAGNCDAGVPVECPPLQGDTMAPSQETGGHAENNPRFWAGVTLPLLVLVVGGAVLFWVGAARAAAKAAG